MNFKHTVRFSVALLITASSFAAHSANRLEGEWRAVDCRYLSNSKQPCETRSGAKILFGSDNIQFYVAGAFDRRDDGVRYVDVGNRTEVYTGTQKQATHVFENSNRMYIDTPTQRFFFERTPGSLPPAEPQKPLGATTVPGKRLFGTWRIVDCDYWRGSERLANVPCRTQRNDHLVVYKLDSVIFNEKERPVSYTDAKDWIDVREQDGEVTRHVFDTKRNEVSMFNNDKANNRLLRFVIVRVDGAPLDSVAPQVPTPPETKDSAQPVLAGDIVPLKRGYYVSSNVPCNRASNADLNLYTGKSFGFNCKVVSNKKINDTTYAMKSKCDERGESLSLSAKYVILSPIEYKVIYEHGASQSRYCEQSQLPEPWRSNDITK